MTTQPTDHSERFGNIPFNLHRDYTGLPVDDPSVPKLTEGERTEVGARKFAFVVYYETGDDSYLRALGVFPETDE